MRPLKRTVFSPVIALRVKLVTVLVRPPGRMSCTVRRTVAGRLISQVIVVPSVACPRRRRATFRRWEAAKRRGVIRSRVMRSAELFAGEVAPGLSPFVPAAGRSASRGGVAPGRFGGFAPGGFVPGAAGGVAPGAAGGVAPGAAGGVAPGAAGGVAAGVVGAPGRVTGAASGGAWATSGWPAVTVNHPERSPPYSVPCGVPVTGTSIVVVVVTWTWPSWRKALTRPAARSCA